MAGLGFKDFQVGEVLTSADVDGYLMQQTVMRFADSAARGSALGTAVGTAVALAEGMVSYLDDANRVAYYSGTEWVPVSKIVNVGQAALTATYSESVGATSFGTAVPGLTVSITPSSASSQILVMVSLNASTGLTTTWGGFRIMRDATPVGVGDTGGSRTSLSAYTNSVTSDQAVANPTMTFLDSPATTSQVDYSVQLWNFDSSTQTLYLNRMNSDATNASNRIRAISTVTVLEVSA